MDTSFLSGHQHQERRDACMCILSDIPSGFHLAQQPGDRRRKVDFYVNTALKRQWFGREDNGQRFVELRSNSTLIAEIKHCMRLDRVTGAVRGKRTRPFSPRPRSSAHCEEIPQKLQNLGWHVPDGVYRNLDGMTQYRRDSS